MAPNTSNSTSTTIQHFTHQEHPLLEAYGSRHEFLCDGCKIPGIGKRYQCQQSCNFNLHLYCGRCPEKLISSFIHPGHELAIVMRKPKSAQHNTRQCDVCRDSVEGMFYRCNICDFDVHPLCTQLPQYLHHVLDSAHKLELKPPSPTIICDICKQKVLKQWCYRCDACSIDIHIECVFASSLPPPQSQSTSMRCGPDQSSLSKSRSLPGVRPNQASPSLFHPSPGLFGQGDAAGFGAVPTLHTPSYGHSHSFGGFGASPHGLPPTYSNMYNNAYQQQVEQMIMASANMYANVYQQQLEQMMVGVRMQNNVYQQQLAQILAGAGGALQQSPSNYNFAPAAAADSSTSTGAGRIGTKVMLSVLGNMATGGLSDVIFGSSGFDLFSLFR